MSDDQRTIALPSLIQWVSDEIQAIDALEPHPPFAASYRAGRRDALAAMYWRIGREIERCEQDPSDG